MVIGFVGVGECAKRRKMTSVEWSADGGEIANGSEDGTIRVWRMSDRTARVITRGQ